MANIVKLDMVDIWASAGDKTAPSSAKINQGWVVEAVPRQTWNWFENRQDNNIAYLFQKGIVEWDQFTEYQTQRSFVQYNGTVYKCILTNTNQTPPAATYWVKAFVDSSAAGEALKGVTPAANFLPYFTSTTAAATTALSAFGRTLIDDADAASARTTLGAQAAHVNLTSLSGVTAVANGLPYFTSTTAMAIATLSAFGRTLIAAVDVASARTVLGLGTAATSDVSTTNAPTTTGSLLKVGDYGWGAGTTTGMPAMDPPSGDLNLCTTAGVYRISSTNTNVPAGYGQGALMITLMWNNATGAQIITQNGSSAMRGGTGLATTPSWTSWLGTWNTNNLTKTTSAIDTTSGSMLKVGDFGLGGTGPVVTNLNSISASGFYKGSASATNSPVTTAFVLFHTTYDTGGSGQMLIDLATGDVWSRAQSSASVWSTWAKQITTANQQAIIDDAVADVQPALALKYDKAGGTITGPIIVDTGATGNAQLELGNKNRTNTPFIDFNSTAGNTDHDSRIIADGGSTTVAGQGNLRYYAAGGHYFTGAITAPNGVLGNASTATKLATARTITLAGDATGSASFDGSADATITVVVADDSHNHIVSNVDGLQASLDAKQPALGFTPVQQGTGTGQGVNDIKIGWGTGSQLLLQVDATDYANTWPVNISKNAATATKLITARTLTLSGDVTGSASFDGTANVTFTTVVTDNSHAHTIANVTGLQAALDAKLATGLTTVSAYGITDVYTKTAGDARYALKSTTISGYGITDAFTKTEVNNTYLPRTEFQANFVSTAATTTVASVGSYAFALNISGSLLEAGQVVAGGSLGYSDTSGDANGALPGSWRCMGRSKPNTVSLFLRYV